MRSTLLIAGLLAGCTDAPKDGPKLWSEMSDSDRQQTLNAFADECRLPHTFFKAIGREVHLRPDADEDFQKARCGLAKLEYLHGASVGFVGNAAYSNEAALNSEVKKPDLSEPVPSEAAIRSAAVACGTKVTISPMSPEIAARLPVGLSPSQIDVDPRATAQQRSCFLAKVRTTRVGFISEPNLPEMKN